MDGTAGDAARRVQHFIRELEGKLTIPVVAYDERLTSRAADELLRERGVDATERRARSDEIAAAIILQDYLSEHAHHHETEFPERLTHR
jgi:putative Holliday junction resolvase